MERAIIFFSSKLGAEAPCPFCPDLTDPYEEVERGVPFEHTIQKIDDEFENPDMNNLLADAVSKLNLHREKVTATPALIINNHAFVSTRGRNFFKGVLEEYLRKWQII